jgi:hypothetical protein
MYEPDGREMIVRFRHEEREPREATLAVDAEDYARMLNDGWGVVEEVQPHQRETISPEEFAAVTGTDRSSNVNIAKHD